MCDGRRARPPLLIVLSGLPGTGKTTVGREAAARLAAVFLRADTIEKPMLDAGWAVEGVGYEVAYALAEDNLEIGLTVVADCVNPWPLTRAAWHEVAAAAGVPSLDVEFVCSDRQEHQRRVESRRAAQTGERHPTWDQVLERDFAPWDGDRLVIDTAELSVSGAVEKILEAVEAIGRDVS